ncbi:MAG: Kinase [uncultured Sulfurovum sp.]|uniref:Kinase n=1 Tax=uncultured Sulfurovum sp. TaxID=269237 RepID=A0A6S6S6X8_9BACT|nr:MAG: Kinase [uncultured Sulfurovum sp.]
MDQLLTANVATNLYWLGRSLERIELTLSEINRAYDKIIDVNTQAGVELYQKFHIDLNYTGVRDFLNQAIRGEHSANIANLMVNARENAIIARPNIDASTFGEIIELHLFCQEMTQSTLNIDYNDIDNILSLINEIWGAHSKKGKRQASDYFLKLGKLIEEVDFRLRFNKTQEMTDVMIKEIYVIINILETEGDAKQSQSQTNGVPLDIMADIYHRVDQLIIE